MRDFEDETELWASCADVEGFFALPANSDGRRLIKLVGASVNGPLLEVCAGRRSGRRARSNAYLQVLDGSEQVIGEYFIAIFGCTDCESHTEAPASDKEGTDDQDLYDVTLDIAADAKSYLIKEIWERWRHEAPKASNMWAGYPTEGRMAWLEVVRTHCRPGLSPDAPAGKTYTLDGRYVTDCPGFYCAIGEAVNGPGGYFGGDLNALSDCLNGDFGATIPFTLRWHDFSVAAQHLNKSLYGEDSLCGDPPLEFGPQEDEDSDTYEGPEDPGMARPYLNQIIEVLEEKSVTILRD